MTRLGDIQQHFRLYGLCVPCGRMAPLPLEDLLRRCGPQITVGRIRERVRCRCCGRRTREVRLVYVGPDGSTRFHHRG